jgi:hypothetical protein
MLTNTVRGSPRAGARVWGVHRDAGHLETEMGWGTWMDVLVCVYADPADDGMAPQVLPDKRMADKKSSVERGVQHQASLTWTTSSGGEGEEHHSVEQVPAHMLPTIGIAKRRVRTKNTRRGWGEGSWQARPVDGHIIRVGPYLTT